MNVLDAVFLGFLQGLTEFLPISSSGHLVVAEAVLKLKAADYLLFDVLLHVATLLAVVIFFRNRLLSLARSSFSWFQKNPVSETACFERGMIVAIVISTVLTGGIGLYIKHWMEGMREQIGLVGWAFLVTGILVFSTRFRKSETASETGFSSPGFWKFGVIMGIVQGIAVLPGVSRSGSTICAALLLGVSKPFAVEYSFLMSIPAILGATLLELKEAPHNVGLLPMACGFSAAFVSGLLFLWVLVWIIGKGHLYRFSYYLFPLGIWVLYYFR